VILAAVGGGSPERPRTARGRHADVPPGNRGAFLHRPSDLGVDRERLLLAFLHEGAHRADAQALLLRTGDGDAAKKEGKRSRKARGKRSAPTSAPAAQSGPREGTHHKSKPRRKKAE